VIVVLLALLVIVIGLAVAVAIGRIPVTGMDDPTHTSPYEGLPDGPVTDEQLEQLRFDQTMRGYRMTQVDRVIDRLRDELLERDREIARLREQADGRYAPAAASTPDDPDRA
jgi:DivIVA domain-containing protein